MKMINNLYSKIPLYPPFPKWEIFPSIKRGLRGVFPSLAKRPMAREPRLIEGEGRFYKTIPLNVIWYKWRVISLIISLIIGFSTIALAREDIGTVVAVRNKATIERDKKETSAKVKDTVFLKDTIATMKASKAKMLFIDDSVLTMGENSKMIIKDFVYSKDKEGKSIFNLLDGKMRSVVGRSNFEVHTHTVVAAARGTVILFETGMRDGRAFTTVICLEGEVSIVNADPSVSGTVSLTPGLTVTMFTGEAPPAPASASPAEIDRIRRDTDTGYQEVSIPEATEIDVGPAVITAGTAETMPEPPPTITPPIEQQPVNTTPVNINVTFP